MRSSLILLTAMTFAVVLISCEPKTKTADPVETGVKKYYYPDGPLYMEVHLQDTVPHGVTTEYFRNGKVYQSTEYVLGEKHGMFKRYYEDGVLALETPYDSGKRHGIEKKYRKDGTVAYEAPYFQDQPTTGLREYYTNGQPVEKYGSIVIEEENRPLDARFSLVVSFSGAYKAEFYAGKLTDGKYIGKDCERLYVIRDGVARVDYNVGLGDFLMDDINIIAKVKTDLGNYFITQRRYNIAIDNR